MVKFRDWLTAVYSQAYYDLKRVGRDWGLDRAIEVLLLLTGGGFLWYYEGRQHAEKIIGEELVLWVAPLGAAALIVMLYQLAMAPFRVWRGERNEKRRFKERFEEATKGPDPEEELAKTKKEAYDAENYRVATEAWQVMRSVRGAAHRWEEFKEVPEMKDKKDRFREAQQATKRAVGIVHAKIPKLRERAQSTFVIGVLDIGFARIEHATVYLPEDEQYEDSKEYQIGELIKELESAYTFFQKPLKRYTGAE